MTTYQCDTCDGEAPGGSAGTAFLVMPSGKTNHFCSNACLRAFVNNAPQQISHRVIIGAIMLATLIGHAVIAFVHSTLH